MAPIKTFYVQEVKVDLWKTCFRINGMPDVVQIPNCTEENVTRIISTILPILRKSALNAAVDLLVRAQAVQTRSNILKLIGE